MLASRGISLALAGGAACFTWGMWASADSPAPKKGSPGRVTPVSATIPAPVDSLAIEADEPVAQDPLERLKARSAEERARRIVGRRSAVVPQPSVDPVAEARRTLPTPDDLRTRRESDPDASPSASAIPSPKTSPAAEPSVEPLPVTAQSPAAPIAEAPLDTVPARTAKEPVGEEPVAAVDLPVARPARVRNESPLAGFIPVEDEAAPRRPARVDTSAEAIRDLRPVRPEVDAEPVSPSSPAPVAVVDEPLTEEATAEETTIPEESDLASVAPEVEAEPVPEPIVAEPAPARKSGFSQAKPVPVYEEPLAALDALPPQPTEANPEAAPVPAARPTPRSFSARRTLMRQTEDTPMQPPTAEIEPTRDPRELKKVNSIRPFKNYEPDEDIFKTDRCQNLCPRPAGEGCPDCKPGMSDDPNQLFCPECPEEVSLNAAEFHLAFQDRNFPALDYRWEAPNIWHYPLYFEDTELERYGHSRSRVIQPFFSAARFGTQFLLFPYRASLLPPWKHDYELGHYRPGRCVPYRYEVLPWNRSAAMWQAGVTTGAYFLFAPTP